MKANLHFRYWILPLLVLTPLLIMYFSGVHWAQELVCPSVNREFGIVENIQLLILLLIIIYSVIAVKKKKYIIEKIAFIFLTIISIFIFLEEIDYGLHYVKYFTGQTHSLFLSLSGRSNVHNIGNTATKMKHVIYPFMGLLFVVAPLIKGKIKSKFFQYIIPHKGIILTAFLTILAHFVPKFLVNWNIFDDGGFGINLVEFSETMIYYVFFVYLYELIFEKKLQI